MDDDFSLPRALLEVRHAGVDFSLARLSVHAHFTGLRALMYHHPVAASCLGIASVSTAVFTALYLFWRKMFEPRVIVPAPPRSQSAASLQDRQERAREALRKSSSQQRIVRRVSEGLVRKQEKSPPKK